MAWKLFGFSLGKKDVIQVQPQEQPALVLPQSSMEDGAVTITQGAYYGTYVDLEGSVRNELELINRYREMSLHPECSMAVDDIVTEAISQDTDNQIVKLNLEALEQPDSIKKNIQTEFDTILQLLNFKNLGEELFRRWYVDGRVYFQIMVDLEHPKAGIQELRYIDPRKIRKVREVLKQRDPRSGIESVQATSEYYVFNDRGLITQTHTASVNQGTKIATDSILYAPSGMLDAKSVMVISHLHKAIKPLNQLRMIEDAVVIYRLSRAPERRVFYIDVGNLPKLKAEQYVHDIMVKYRNKVVYDSNTGEVRDERKHLSMLEDFWLPRREGSKGTEITTLPAGQNLGELTDVIYFRKKLYQSLNVPMSRLDDQSGGGIGGLGRAAEITRDEVKFFKFIQRLRRKFTAVFDDALRVQLSLKGICSLEEWDILKQSITYDFMSDNHYYELRDAELTQNRVMLAGAVEPYVGKYYSQNWVRQNILRLTEEEIEKMEKEIEEEQAAMPETAPGAPEQPVSGAAPVPNPAASATPEPDPQEAGATQSMTPDLDAEVERASKRYK